MGNAELRGNTHSSPRKLHSGTEDGTVGVPVAKHRGRPAPDAIGLLTQVVSCAETGTVYGYHPIERYACVQPGVNKRPGETAAEQKRELQAVN